MHHSMGKTNHKSKHKNYSSDEDIRYERRKHGKISAKDVKSRQKYDYSPRSSSSSKFTSHRAGHSSEKSSHTRYKRNKYDNDIYKQSYKDDRDSHSEYDKSRSTEEENFTYLDYRHELNQLFFKGNTLVDLEDFWLFVKKYELVKKKAAGQKSSNHEVPVPADDNPLGIPNSYDKAHLVNIHLRSDLNELWSRLPCRFPSQEHLSKFIEIVLLYLDFKQKEKFSKLKKLRQTQANLPVAQYRDQIINSIKKESVIIIAGDTGCGKSTQIPQYLLAAGYKKIACTQPRRIACISLSKRVAHETLNEYGAEVGYQIRFERTKNKHTKILFITEGLLLRQVSTDPTLSCYDVVVLDEVHERHLHGDFLLGVIKCLLYQRPDLKVILMSATINIQLFSDYFSDQTTIIQIPGRLYPIKVHYSPVTIEDRSSKSERINPAPYVRILQLIDKKYPKEEKGDVLIFLSGMSEISTVVEAAKQYAQESQNWVVLPLHSTLSIADQDKCFDYPPEYVRKCIVSTNIAETSVTIDGIRFVVDSGKVKEMSYDPICKMQRLKEFWISRASAEQRKGRAGRTGPGVCYRLYSEEEYQSMEQYTTPEIQRVPLDTLLLQMVAMGLPDARKFPFIEPPSADSIENAIHTLKQQGALTEDERLTAIGEMLSKLPVDISIGKMLIMGSLFHQIEPVLSLAAALSVQNPLTNRAYRDTECETSRKQLESDHGDPITLLNAFREWLEVKNSRESSRRWCRRRGLEEQRFYEMTKLRRQFKELLQDANLLQDDAVPFDHMSSAERTLRQGELKLLHSLKRSYQETTPKKRRTLKIDTWEIAGEEEGDEPGDIDIRDVEFRLSNDNTQVQNLLSGATACSYRDVMMLKVILCAGLYPQLAIADEFNYCKSVAEQLFHTQGKPYVSLHPMSFFGNNPKVLQLEEPDIAVVENFTSKLPVSSKHQILCYLSLLETNKAYLVNSMRMPAAHTLFLFSQEIDTDGNFSRFVCDSWLQLEFPSCEMAAKFLLRATNLRNKWEKLLKLRLEGMQPSVRNETKWFATVSTLEHELSESLPQFMHTDIVYTIKRLLPADLKTMYVGPEYSEDIVLLSNPFHSDWKSSVHPKKGGLQLTSYMVYNCLIDDKELNYETWKCDDCELVASLTIMERLQHEASCKAITSSQDSKTQEEEVINQRKPNSQEYKCEVCNKTLYLTPTEILKHKRQHL